jgi:hypothetical protein
VRPRPLIALLLVQLTTAFTIVEPAVGWVCDREERGSGGGVVVEGSCGADPGDAVLMGAASGRAAGEAGHRHGSAADHCTHQHHATSAAPVAADFESRSLPSFFMEPASRAGVPVPEPFLPPRI